MSNIYLNNGEWEDWGEFLDGNDMKTIKKVAVKKITPKTVRNDDRTGSMTGAPSHKERAAMEKKVMPKFKAMPMKVNKVTNSTPMIKNKKKK